MNYKLSLLLFFCFLTAVSEAQIIASYTLKQNPDCAGNNALFVFSAKQIPALSGKNINKLSMFHLHNKKWQKIVFQIDQKDGQGRYLMNTANIPIRNKLAAQDELLFKEKELAERIDHFSSLSNAHSLLELEVITDNRSRWIYIDIDSEHSEYDLNDNDLLAYDAEQDIVSSSLFKIGFAKAQPFLLEHLHWRINNGTDWSSDLADTMKIRHRGKFMGFQFKRTQNDYDSLLLAVKEGPLRIIRRTENRIKVFWKLKSPVLTIDYSISYNGFVMDSMIDIPFKIAYFFSDLVTITTMDWNDTHWNNLQEESEFKVQSSKDYPEIIINGKPSDIKRQFNQLWGKHFSLAAQGRVIDVKLDIPDDFPITSMLYLKDNIAEPDTPENNPGQYGNIGFKTLGWENIDNKLYHLKFTVCVLQEEQN